MVSLLTPWANFCLIHTLDKVRAWEQLQASWRATRGGAKRQRIARAHRSHQPPASCSGCALGAPMAEGHRASKRGSEETQVSFDEQASTMTSVPQDILRMPTERDPSVHTEPMDYSLDIASHTTDTSSVVLDPSSHAENVDLAFLEFSNLLHDGTASLFDPSSHAQNIHFPTFDPAEHVQGCAIGGVDQFYATPTPTTINLDQSNTVYPITDTPDGVLSASAGATAHQETMARDLPPVYANRHVNSMECMQNLVPEVELRPQQISTPNDTNRPTCSQPTRGWQPGVHQNFMVSV